jgi:protein gp37
MSANSKIEWTDHTFNPWIGCTKVSPGCANCYAESYDKRTSGGKHWGKGAWRRRTTVKYWDQARKWNDDVGPSAANWGAFRPRVFPSLCDWLDPEVPIEWLADFLALIYATPNLDWLLLTKRPEEWRSRVCAAVDRLLLSDRLLFAEKITQWIHATPAPPRNVWLGVSVENQKRADERIPLLLQTPAAIRFLSCEPLLGEINLAGIRDSKTHATTGAYLNNCLHADRAGNLFETEGVDWVIVGGESGPKARPCDLKWIAVIVQQCKEANVSVFVKQLGAKPVIEWEEVKLRHPKGGDIDEWPVEQIRVREFPENKAVLASARVPSA